MEHARKIERFTPPTTELDALLAGSSASMREVTRAIGQLACTDVHLLLQGERGTGKRDSRLAVFFVTDFDFF